MATSSLSFVACVAFVARSVVASCSSSEYTDLSVYVFKAKVPNKDSGIFGDKADAYAKIHIDGKHRKSETIYNDNHPHWDETLHLGCVLTARDMLVEAWDLDPLSGDDRLVRATWESEDWTSYDYGVTKRLHHNDDPAQAYYMDVSIVPTTPSPTTTSVPTNLDPTGTPTVDPTALPSPSPTPSPTTPAPSPKPTWSPISAPTRKPTSSPSSDPTHKPTPSPTTSAPTLEPRHGHHLHAATAGSNWVLTLVLIAVVAVAGVAGALIYRRRQMSSVWNKYRWQRAPRDNEFATPSEISFNPIKEMRNFVAAVTTQVVLVAASTRAHTRAHTHMHAHAHVRALAQAPT